MALALLVVAPLSGAVGATGQRRHVTRAQVLAADNLIGSFTPAAADPKLSGAFGRLGSGASGLRFTPSGTSARRPITVAVRARAVTRADAERIAEVAATAPSLSVAPSSYSLGAAIGWRRFAVSGDYGRYQAGLMPGGREIADVALSYGGRSWSTRVALAAERSTDGIRALGSQQSVSLDLGGSYTLSHNFDVTGGVRYRIQRDKIELSDERRDSQALYIGTAFRF